MFRNFKVLFAVLAILVIMGGAYAFAASNGDIPTSAAGYSSQVVAGYTVTDLQYHLDATNPTFVASITFKVAGAVLANTVELQTATGGAWKVCEIGTPAALVQPITCTYTDPTLAFAAVTATNIVASSNATTAP